MSGPTKRPEQTTLVSAPGKAFLIGEYAVLEGASAVVTAVNIRAQACAASAPGRTSEIVRAAHAEILRYLQDRALPDPGPPPIVDTGSFRLGSRKIGLGSSAAVAATVVGFLLEEAGIKLSSAEGRAAAYKLARSGHRLAQGGGSGADVATSICGGTLRFKDGEATPIELPTWLRIGFVDAGAPASTASFVQMVREAALRVPDPYSTAMRDLQDASQKFLAVLADATTGQPSEAMLFAALKGAVDHHNRGLRALQQISGAPIMTPTIERILEVAADMGLAAKPSGAGGGDLVVVFARSQAALDLLADRLRRDHNIDLLSGLRAGAEGLRAEPRTPRCSRIPGFFRLTVEERRQRLATACDLDLASFDALDPGALPIEQADHLIENVIGVLEVPIAVATNFRINGVDYLVPMSVEEASVVAAASNAAKMIRAGGGFVAHSDPPWMIAQIQLCRDDAVGDAARVRAAIESERSALLELADAVHPRLRARGGGPRTIEIRVLAEDLIAVHVVVDCRDAMGANLLNTVAEALAPRLHALSGWRVGLRILSNLADRRRAHVSARISPATLASRDFKGAQVVDGIVSASRFAELDPYRAATHNKGIMNGMDAVVLATGNDWRAMESGAHSYAAQGGHYRPLAVWTKDEEGWLVGQLTVPMAIGMVGGATHVHPVARLALSILGCTSSAELGQVIAATGLASNLAALRALATEGIQRGHMSLHARTLAVGAGATGDEIETLCARLIAGGEIKHDRAVAILREVRHLEKSAARS